MAKKPRIIAVSGGFDPIHAGHVRLLMEARKLSEKLIVILNNDNWLFKKKGFVFMPEQERKEIIQSIRYVDEVILSDHPHNPVDMSVCSELKKLKPDIFANGGDRLFDNIPEIEACKKLGCEMVFNIGEGGKVQSSSWLLKNYLSHHDYRGIIRITDQPEIHRPWGGYTILQKSPSFWVKKLFVKKGLRTSLQSHKLREEVWFVLSGNAIAQVDTKEHSAQPGDVFHIPKKHKHRLTGIENACILEVSFGKILERDIVRYEDDYGRV